MKDDNTFNEELFRDAFSDFSPEPPKDMLNKIQQTRGRSNKSTNHKKWIAGVAVLIIAGAFGVNNYTPDSEVNTVPKEIIIPEVEDIIEEPLIEEVQLNETPKTEEKIEKNTVIIEKVDTIRNTVIIEAPSNKDIDEDVDF